jgi:hypothetical protein
MRLHSGMSEEKIYEALVAAVASTWGQERIEADREVVESAARHIWRVLQVPMTPMSEEPELLMLRQSDAGR